MDGDVLVDAGRIPELIEYFQQLDIAISQHRAYFQSMQAHLAVRDEKMTMHYVELLRGIEHVLEGNITNIKSILTIDNPALNVIRATMENAVPKEV